MKKTDSISEFESGTCG